MRWLEQVATRSAPCGSLLKSAKLPAPDHSEVPVATRVKICGITRLEDALAAANAGADAIGFVFYGPSPRNMTPEKAAEIVHALPPFVTTVGLFVDAPVEWVEAVVHTVPLDLLQFHGDEIGRASCR